MGDNAELESFRRQWREEVARRARKGTGPKPTTKSKPSASSDPWQERFPPTRHEASERKEEQEEDEEGSGQYDQSGIVQQVGQLSLNEADEDAFHRRVPQKEPSSALEHFERAVQKEAEGNLGDSLQHYRKAYRVRHARFLGCQKIYKLNANRFCHS